VNEMKVKVDGTLTDLNGIPVKESISGKLVDITFKKLFARCLTETSPQETQSLTAEIKLKRFTLAQKIVACKDEINLNPEEIKMIRVTINKAFNPLVVGMVNILLSPEEKTVS